MSQPPLRFLHAGDLHLERPLSGVSEIPPHLRENFLEAPYLAAEQVFETALAEGVDALLLAGDVLQVDRAGPRAVVFLADQFRRLANHGIAVYWAGGSIDPPDAWPACAPLPELVRRFPAGRVGNFEHQRGGKTVARIQGISRSPGQFMDDSGFHRDANGLFTVGVAYGTASSPGGEGDRVHYMAIGGQHRRQTVDQSPGIAHYAGTPQGRDPSETGAAGCTLVSVDDSGHVKTTFFPTDVLRWIDETIELTGGATDQTLLNLMDQRITALKAKHPGRDLLITWHLEGRCELVNRIHRGGLGDELLLRLRQQYGHGSTPAWSVGIECDEPLCVPAEWYDEETIRGDMLRQYRELEADADISLDLEEFLPDGASASSVSGMADVTAAERSRLLLAASKIGIDMLGLDEDEN